MPPPWAPSQYTRLDPNSQHPQSTHSTSTHGPLDPVPCRPLGQSALSDHPIFAVSWPAGQSARQPPGQSAPCRGSLGVGWWRGRSPIECWGGGGAPALLHAEMWGPRVLTLTARCAAHRILPTHHFFFPSPPPPHCMVARVGALAHGAAAVPGSSGMQPCSSAKAAGPLRSGHAAVTALRDCEVAPVLLGTRGRWLQKDDTACAPALRHRVYLSQIPHPRATSPLPPPFPICCPQAPPHSTPIPRCHSLPHLSSQPLPLSCPITCPCALSPSPLPCPFPARSLPLS